MRVLAAIRTHRWTAEEERLLATLRGVFGGNVAVAFQNRPEGLQPPVDVVDIGADWPHRNRLRAVPDWGWRCGDYFYYALRLARPEFDHYWLIEPDVLFTGDAAAFFEQFDAVPVDLLGKNIEEIRASIPFTRGLPGMRHMRSIFCLTRMSGREIDRLLPLRQAYGRRKIGPHLFTNDEIFTFSHICADPEMTVASMQDIAPGWFERGQLETNPDILLDTLQGRVQPDAVFHPVRGRESFKAAVANRLAGNDGFLRNMRWSLASLTDGDLEDIVSQTAESLRQSLLVNRRTGLLTAQAAETEDAGPLNRASRGS